MTRRALLLGSAFLLIALSSGCHRNEHHVKEQRIPDSERASLTPGPTLPRLNIVPSHGTCGPKADNVAVFGSCCNELACNGQCVRDDTDKIGCSCFAVKGGCQNGLVCSKIRRGCVKPIDAQLP